MKKNIEKLLFCTTGTVPGTVKEDYHISFKNACNMDIYVYYTKDNYPFLKKNKKYLKKNTDFRGTHFLVFDDIILYFRTNKKGKFALNICQSIFLM